jgi:hypothetical protein
MAKIRQLAFDPASMQTDRANALLASADDVIE